jgi:hypothetical protein
VIGLGHEWLLIVMMGVEYCQVISWLGLVGEWYCQKSPPVADSRKSCLPLPLQNISTKPEELEGASYSFENGAPHEVCAS